MPDPATNWPREGPEKTNSIPPTQRARGQTVATRPQTRSLKGPYALLIVAVVLGAVGAAIYLALKDAIAMRGRAAPLTAPSAIDAAAREHSHLPGPQPARSPR